MTMKSFQTCLLVSALACLSNAQLYFNLETDEFSYIRKSPPLHKLHEHVEEDSPLLDH